MKYSPLQFLQDDVADFILNDLEQGAQLSRNAALYGFSGFPMQRETFLFVAPWLLIPEKQFCFYASHAVMGLKGEAYKGPMLLLFDVDLVNPDWLFTELNISGEIIPLGVVLDEIAKAAN